MGVRLGCVVDLALAYACMPQVIHLLYRLACRIYNQYVIIPHSRSGAALLLTIIINNIVGTVYFEAQSIQVT